MEAAAAMSVVQRRRGMGESVLHTFHLVCAQVNTTGCSVFLPGLLLLNKCRCVAVLSAEP